MTLVLLFIAFVLMFLTYHENIEKFNVLQIHTNIALAQILSYNTTLYHRELRRYKLKGVKIPAPK